MEQHANNYVQLIMGEKTLSPLSRFFSFFFSKKNFYSRKYARGMLVV